MSAGLFLGTLPDAEFGVAGCGFGFLSLEFRAVCLGIRV